MPLKNYEIKYLLTPGSHGVLIEYREVGTLIWVKPVSAPNPTMAQSYIIELETGKSYYIRLTSQGPCPPSIKLITLTVPTDGMCCAPGFTLSPDGTICYQQETVAPTIQQSDICLATSVLASDYAVFGSRIYNPGFDVNLQTYTLVGTLMTPDLWFETGNLLGPFNREGVWVDADCNGVKDALAFGSTLQFSAIVDVPTDRTIYVGIGGDNTFRLDVSNTAGEVTIVDIGSGAASVDGNPQHNFKFWHVLPVALKSGPNILTFKSVGDGSNNDAFAAVVYDNTLAEIQAATVFEDLNIIFKTSTYRGSRIDLATCAAGYQLDTSGGQGNYVCRRTITDAPYSC